MTDERCRHCKNRGSIWMCLECYGEYFVDERLITIEKTTLKKLLDFHCEKCAQDFPECEICWISKLLKEVVK